jgi:hypothetical protein
MALPLSSLPSRPHLLLAPNAKDRGRPEASGTTFADDKLVTLHAYHRAHDLYFTCDEQWGRDHHYGPTVPLHVVEELLDMVQPHENITPLAETEDIAQGDQLMHISQGAAEGSQATSTMLLQGWIQQQEVLMLVDSGSSLTFVSSTLADRLLLPHRAI